MIVRGPQCKEDSMAATARDLMTEGCECAKENETLVDAARKLADLNVGSMPICGEDDKLKGMLTDRDIVVKAVAEGKDPATTTASELAEGVPVTVSVDDPEDKVLETMAENQIRRVPVLDGDKKLVGIVSQADVATQTSANETGGLVSAISAG
jgi:CBS domain-containing protein